MPKYLFISFLFLFSFLQRSSAQSCIALGQNPGTAFPVCGTDTFHQGSVPICGIREVPTPCPKYPYVDKNPYWYKFTCFSSGTLGFKITPNNLGDDYDWQIFDVTGRDPSAVYTDPSLFVACNWSAEFGVTGASSAGNSLVRCEGPGVPIFSAMPNITAGHNYIMLVSHFTDSQEGYSLSFGGGSAVITDPLDPHITRASASCDATSVTIQLNKKMKCSSLASNGSDFTINTTSSNITGASAICTGGFDMDSVLLQLSAPLSPGNYIFTIKKGNDGNTLLDNCDREVPEGETVLLTILPLAPTPMDSLTRPGCSPDSIVLVFKKRIKCSTIAPDGSDFNIAGPYPVMVTGANGACANDLTTKIIVHLSAPLQVAGNFTLSLKQGNDGNTIFDECAQETPPSSLPFTIKDTVNADFTYSIDYACDYDTLHYFHNGKNTVNSWTWTFDYGMSSNVQNPVISYDLFEDTHSTLIVSNGVCTDTSSRDISFENLIHAKIETTPIVCPNDPEIVVNNTIGKHITNWAWDFGNGATSNLKDPPPQYYITPVASYSTLVKLFVTNSFGCTDSAMQLIRILDNCYIAVPSAFTPNGDGLNDYLYPLNAYKAINLHFSVYNRFGQRIFYTTNWLSKWDGKFKGQGVDAGTYVWILEYTNKDTGRKVEQKGTTVLIR